MSEDQAKATEFVVQTPTTAEFDSASEEVTLPCGLVATVMPAAETPQQANLFRKSSVAVVGKKVLDKPSRATGAPNVRIQTRAMAEHYLVTLRTPGGQPLVLRGVGTNGASDVEPRTWADGIVESFDDKHWVLETYPVIRSEVAGAVDTISEEFAESLEREVGN